ncbi:MAG: hypothetical protein ACREFO_08850 [Acetobacteraceae bacterium]
MLEGSLGRTELRNRLSKMLAEIEELVDVDSGSYVARGGTRVSRRIGEHLAKPGFEPSFAAAEERGDRLHAPRKSGGLGRRMVPGHPGRGALFAGLIATLPHAENTQQYPNSSRKTRQ